jgi:uncharacterized membrane protein YqiK
LKTIAQAEAEKVRITAEGDSLAEKLRADATERTLAVEAAGKRKLHEADNILSSEQIAMHVRMAVLKVLPEIIRESVKPMEQIDGIKIVQVEGLNANSASATKNGAGGAPGEGHMTGHNGNLAEQVVNSALRYRVQAPLVDSLLGEVGLNGAGDMNELTSILRNEVPKIVSAPPSSPNAG